MFHLKNIPLLLLTTIILLILSKLALQSVYRLGHGNWRWQKDSFQIGHLRPVPDRLSADQEETHESYPIEPMLKNINQVLDENLEFCARNAITVILMPPDPFYYQLKNQERNPELPQWKVPIYQNLLRVRGTMYDEFSDELKKAADRFPNTYFFDTRVVMDDQDRARMHVDYIHYSPAGNLLIAHKLLAFMETQRLLP